MRVIVNAVFLFGVVLPMAALAAVMSTPEAAIKALEAAYISKDLDAALAAKDFQEEARLMLTNINPELSNDPSIVKQTAEVLELGFKKEIKDKGFPDFKALKCTLSAPIELSATLVRVHESCLFTDGGTSEQDLYVFKSANGWRVVNVPG